MQNSPRLCKVCPQSHHEFADIPIDICVVLSATLIYVQPSEWRAENIIQFDRMKTFPPEGLRVDRVVIERVKIYGHVMAVQIQGRVDRWRQHREIREELVKSID